MNKLALKYFYLIIGLINVVSWLFFEGAYNEFTKPLLMPILMLYLYECFKGKVVFETLLIFGALVFSWLGDLALMFPDKYFLPGVGAFLVAQLLYIRLFYGHRVAIKEWTNIKSAAIGVYGIILLYLLLPSAGALMIPVGIYGITLITMAIVAANTQSTKRNSIYMFGLLGAILFVVSDSMIAMNKFMYDIPNSSFWIMSTYIAAQYLLVESLTRRTLN